MAKVKAPSSSSSNKKMSPPALTPEAREDQMISLAVNLAEKQLIEGTASSQVITHFLKLATVREQLERERLAKENELLAAKTKAMESAERVEELYANAIKAMQLYGGHGESDDY